MKIVENIGVDDKWCGRWMHSIGAYKGKWLNLLLFRKGLVLQMYGLRMMMKMSYGGSSPECCENGFYVVF